MPKAGYSNGFQSQVFYSGSFSIPGYRFTGEFGLTGYRNFKYQVWGAEFTAPLYYFRNNLYLEGGLAYFQRDVSFDYESYVNGTLTSPYNLDPPNGFNNEVYKVNFNWHKFVPVLSVLYNVYKTGTAGLSYMGGKSLRLSLSLGLDF